MYANSKSTLAPEVDALIERIIGCALTVHRALGPGFLESIYAAAVAYELTAAGIPFERERAIYVAYRELRIPGQRVDLIVAGQVIVELKAVRRLEPVFDATILSYMKTTGIRAGLLINFHETLLKTGIRRFVL